ncbi:SpoIIE family protein phosphatase [Streptomyces sp. NPDC004561]
MGGLGALGASSRRLPPRPESAASARRFVRAALGGVAPDVVETAELLTGELVTNAVLHARTEVEVRAKGAADRVHVQVTDERPDRGLTPHECLPYAATGRGLALVQELSSDHGVRVDADRKTVWFELWNEVPVPPSSPWEAVPPSGPTVPVTLIDLPYALYTASRQHREALLRELTLMSFSGPPAGLAPQDLVTAQDMSNLISAYMTAAVEEETPGTSTLGLRVVFPADAAPAVTTLGRLLDTSDAAAQQGNLLTLPALPQVRAMRGWLLDQIVSQLSGGRPTAWTLVRSAPSATSTELAPWDASEVETSSVPTVAADDGNRIIAVNAAAAELLGWQPDDLVGRRLTTLIPEHLRQRHVAAFTSLLLTGQPRILGRSLPLPALHRDGRLVPIRLHIQTQEAVDGRTVFVAQLGVRTISAVSPHEAEDHPPAVRPRPGALRRPLGAPAALRPAHREGDAYTDRGAPERLSLLADVSSALTSTLDLNEGLHRVCQVLTRQLADWCVVDLLDEQGRAERVCVVHRHPEALRPGVHLGTLPPMSEATRGPLPRVLRGAGPLLLTDTSPPGAPVSALDACQVELFQQLGGSSAVIAPLRARREVLGALTVVRVDGEQPFTDADLPLLTDLMHGIALGVDNARLHLHTRRTAERMQRALLPELPDVDHLELTARYAPSSADAQVGGDWFDAFLLPTGDTALVIGDVSGHDLQAAVAMSQLRNLLRGIAVDRQEPPAEVVHRFDLACQTLYPQATATCVYGVVKGVEGGPWELRHSSAGHPPILLTTPEGDTRYLEAGAGMLIGVDPSLPRVTAHDPLPAHSTLLMFTDGLIERRGESLDDAMARLRQHTAALARAPLDVFCDELVIGLGTDTTDDIALLALRPAPPL